MLCIEVFHSPLTLALSREGRGDPASTGHIPSPLAGEG